MDKAKFVIRTYKRVETIKKKTLSFLEYNNVPKENIYIFCGEDEQQIYTDSLDPKYHILNGGSRGMAYVDNRITDYFAEDTYIILMDDDINESYQLCLSNQKKKNERNGKNLPKNMELLNLRSLVERGYNLMKKYNLSLFGMYPVCNSYFMEKTKEVDLDLNFCIGRLCGFLNKKDILIVDDLREDYERTILHFRKSGGVIRFNHTCCDADTYKGTGGLELFRTKEKMEKSVSYMLDKYPDVVKRKNCKSKYSEIRLIKKKSIKYFIIEDATAYKKEDSKEEA
jgi:Mor family transcriptional regulator